MGKYRKDSQMKPKKLNFISKLNHYLRRLNLGFQIELLPQHLIRRQKLIQHFEIDCVIDVGANIGQFGAEMRKIGYSSNIFSFEPLKGAFRELQEKAQNSPPWHVFNYGMGDKTGNFEINVSAASASSSLLPMLPRHLQAAPYTGFTGKETIKITTLDEIAPELNLGKYQNVLLKIDTQGFEKQVINGAVSLLKKIDSIMLEMSLTKLYEGEMDYLEMSQKLSEMGFTMVSTEPGFEDQITGQQLQIDAIWHRFRENK